jgi:hypothetical protein
MSVGWMFSSVKDSITACCLFCTDIFSLHCTIFMAVIQKSLLAEIWNFTQKYGKVYLNECSLVHTITWVCFLKKQRHYFSPCPHISGIRNLLSLFISVVGLPASSFNPKDCIKHWLRQGHQDANYTACTAPTLRCSEDQNIWKLLKVCCT